ncbi:MAG: 30S ribosomal protein S24e [Candidatus Micrarchaeia archaeon]
MVEVKILEKKDNPILKRKEVKCLVDFEAGTPKKEEIQQAIAKALTAHPELVYINEFIVRAGAKQGKAEVFLYDSKDILEKMHKKKEKKEKKK